MPRQRVVMKICPKCQTRYDDPGLTHCPEDGVLLVREGAPNNPRLAEVIPVDESAETRMLDISSLREDIDDEEEPRQPDEPESGATEPISDEQLQQAIAEARQARAAAAGGTVPERLVDHTVQVQRPRVEPRRGMLAAMIALIALVIVIGGALTFLLWPKPTYLHITASPTEAKVEIDNVVVGQAPVDLEIPPGPHTVSLTLDGYHPFTQVVDVPKQGRLLTVALVKKEPESQAGDDNGATLAVRADAIFAEVDALIAVNDFNAADARLQVLAALVPGDTRVAAALKRVADARAAAEPVKPVRPPAQAVAKDDAALEKMTKKEREIGADRLHHQGQKLYAKGDLAGAKEALLQAIRYDPKFYPPHRVLARIYNREKNVAKAKYHLNRYIELGGPDDDYKIRQWLATH
ncbi:MAG: PEGA domain-containing protein [Deltaproteobacteria bacterium]|nr:PEGA domain-containing protein [Deltaproteobacteria bacterium]